MLPRRSNSNSTTALLAFWSSTARSKSRQNGRALQASRRQELKEWLGHLGEYDDSFTRRLVERIAVIDTETIRVKLRDTDVEIE